MSEQAKPNHDEIVEVLLKDIRSHGPVFRALHREFQGKERKGR